MTTLMDAVCLGVVSSVSGARVAVALNPGFAALAGQARVGGLVRVGSGQTRTFGLIAELAVSRPFDPPGPDNNQMMLLDLIGEAVSPAPGAQPTFARGVSRFPCPGDPAFLADPEDVALVYAPPRFAHARIGRVSQDEQTAASVLVDDLLGKHFAILGATGSGKSCALAVILRAILKDHPQAHVVLLDPHDEYGASLGSLAQTVTPADLQLPYWFLNFDELRQVLCSEKTVTSDIEAGILREAVVGCKRDHMGAAGAEANLTADTPVPYRLTRLIERITEAMGRLDKPENSLPYLRLLARIDALRRDQRFAFMFSGVVVTDILSEVISRILRLPVNGKPATIIALAGTPSEIVGVVVGLLCRLIFDFALWSRLAEHAPVLLICEEAHRYVPREGIGEAAMDASRAAIARIAKEGRKYGVALGLLTQRPSEISQTVLSQCGTLFAMRLANEQDQDFVRRALPESAAGLLAALPALRPREAVAVGEGVSAPMRLRFDDLDPAHRPRGKNAPFSTAWSSDTTGTDVPAAIDRWRKQTR